MKNVLTVIILVIGMASCETSPYVETSDDFKIEDDKMHYVILAYSDVDRKKINKAKSTISTFNGKYYEEDDIKITDLHIDPKTNSNLILIRRFDDNLKAMDYITSTKTNSFDFVNKSEVEYDIFAVTQNNYKKIVKQESVKTYRDFYGETYLK